MNIEEYNRLCSYTSWGKEENLLYAHNNFILHFSFTEAYLKQFNF